MLLLELLLLLVLLLVLHSVAVEFPLSTSVFNRRFLVWFLVLMTAERDWLDASLLLSSLLVGLVSLHMA